MKTTFAAALIGASMMAAPAMAWNETQPATDGMAVYAYPSAANYCPAGLQPVIVGGVICCGTATHHGYESNAHPRRSVRTHKPAATYVSYGKGADGVVVYEKGQ